MAYSVGCASVFRNFGMILSCVFVSLVGVVQNEITIEYILDVEPHMYLRASALCAVAVRGTFPVIAHNRVDKLRRGHLDQLCLDILFVFKKFQTMLYDYRLYMRSLYIVFTGMP